MIVARAFSYFSHLANLAEDLHHSRRKRQADDRRRAAGRRQPGAGARPGRGGRRRARRAGRRSSATAWSLPVLTAHPTEVQRKSVRDLEMQIEQPAAGARTHSPHAAGTGGQRRIDPPRGARAVADPHAAAREARRARRGGERPVVLRADVPARGAAAVRRARGRTAAALPGCSAAPELPSFLRIGSWIGGDRDGNPFVTADVLERTLRMQSSRVFEFYLEQLHALGAELSMTTLVTDGLAGTDRAGRTLARHEPAPARRTVPPRAHRPVCARRRHGPRRSTMHEPLRHAVGEAPPYARRRGVRRRPRDHPSLARSASTRPCSRAAACAACDAPSTSSASTSPRSTCGRTPTCTSASSPNCSPRRGRTSTTRRSTKPARIRVLVAGTGDPAPARARRSSSTPPKPAANSRSCRPRRGCSSATARRASPTT